MHASEPVAQAEVHLLGELARRTAPPAGTDEIGDQGLRFLARFAGSEDGVVVVWDPPDAPPRTVGTMGRAEGRDLLIETIVSARSQSELLVERRAGDGPVEVVALLLPGDVGPVGAIGLVSPGRWDERSRAVALAACRILSSALRASMKIEASRHQREALSQRNVELEALRELSERLLQLKSDDQMLQAGLDLVLDRLRLDAGWIFLGEQKHGRLDLVACRGVAPEFEESAREEGIGRCLCSEVFESGKLLFARNTLDCPRLPELVRGDGPMTHACVPLKLDRGVLGVMNIANRPGRVFSPQELRFLETVGRQVSLAVDKARTSRAEGRANAEARALASIARATGGSLDLPRVLEAVGEFARDLLAAERCAIFLEAGYPSMRFAYLTGPEIPGLTVGTSANFEAMASRAFQAAILQKHTLVFQDAQTDARANQEVARAWDVRGAIVVPLIAHDRLQGLLLATRSRSIPWSPEQVELADALGRQAAVAIENARLFRQAQDALVRLQEAQESIVRAERLATVGTLAASLAHEVRNPLNSINLQLVLLTRRIARLDETHRGPISDAVETARREIARLDGLVQEFLTLSTVERLAMREVDPDEPIREVVTLMTPMARERGIAIRDSLAGGLPRVRLDPEKFKQVLINLIRNAFDAMPGGGSVYVSSRKVENGILVRVKDTGVGIGPDLDVFDLFMTTKKDGTGLGLPIARRIVEAHGGTLTFESAVGRGATFSIALKTE